MDRLFWTFICAGTVIAGLTIANNDAGDLSMFEADASVSPGSAPAVREIAEPRGETLAIVAQLHSVDWECSTECAGYVVSYTWADARSEIDREKDAEHPVETSRPFSIDSEDEGDDE